MFFILYFFFVNRLLRNSFVWFGTNRTELRKTRWDEVEKSFSFRFHLVEERENLDFLDDGKLMLYNAGILEPIESMLV